MAFINNKKNKVELSVQFKPRPFSDDPESYFAIRYIDALYRVGNDILLDWDEFEDLLEQMLAAKEKVRSEALSKVTKDEVSEWGKKFEAAKIHVDVGAAEKTNDGFMTKIVFTKDSNRTHHAMKVHSHIIGLSNEKNI